MEFKCWNNNKQLSYIDSSIVKISWDKLICVEISQSTGEGFVEGDFYKRNTMLRGSHINVWMA